MPGPWQLEDAQSRFCEVVEHALRSGPHTVMREGEAVAVVVAVGTWRRVSAPAPSLKSFLRVAPLDGLDLSRDSGERLDVMLP